MKKRSALLYLVPVTIGLCVTLAIEDVEGKFLESDPKANDPVYVNECLDKSITGGKKEEAERIARFAADKAGKYGVLIMIKFKDDLSLGKVQQMKEQSPERWKLFNSYLTKAASWTRISIKAGKFTGKNLLKKLKKELGEL